MHYFVWTDAHWVDHCPASARVYCRYCGIDAVGTTASTQPEDYGALERELVERYMDDCDVAAGVVLIESVMNS